MNESDFEIILAETLRGFDGIKAAAQQALKAATDEAKRNLDNVLDDFNNICEEIRKSTENNIKKQVKAVLKEQSKRLTQVEKESIRLIRETWNMSKVNLQKMLDSSKTTLGTQSKGLEKTLKEMMKCMDRLIEDFVRTIREYAKTVQSQLKNNSQKYIKNVYLTRL